MLPDRVREVRESRHSLTFKDQEVFNVELFGVIEGIIFWAILDALVFYSILTISATQSLCRKITLLS